MMMDPNTTLERIRELTANDKRHPVPSELAELVDALDNWMSNGGFLPKDWEWKP